MYQSGFSLHILSTLVSWCPGFAPVFSFAPVLPRFWLICPGFAPVFSFALVLPRFCPGIQLSLGFAPVLPRLAPVLPPFLPRFWACPVRISMSLSIGKLLSGLAQDINYCFMHRIRYPVLHWPVGSTLLLLLHCPSLAFLLPLCPAVLPPLFARFWAWPGADVYVFVHWKFIPGVE